MIIGNNINVDFEILLIMVKLKTNNDPAIVLTVKNKFPKFLWFENKSIIKNILCGYTME